MKLRSKLGLFSIILVGLSIFTLFSFGKRVKGDFPKKSILKFNKEVPVFKSGDLIFQSSTAGQGKAIQLATKSPYSHVGIIFEHDNGLFVIEAVQPVKITPLKYFIDRTANKEYVVKRLKNAEDVLTPKKVIEMKNWANEYLGKDYDLYFEWSNERIYCSELVWKMYQENTGIEIGELQTLQSFDLTHPIVQQKMKERYGDKVPMDELVISPGAMFDSELLEEVYAE